MTRLAQRVFSPLGISIFLLVSGLSGLLIVGLDRGTHSRIAVAVIPQTEGVNFWDSVHVGAEFAARESGASIYWNAPMREDDVEAQIALVESIIHRKLSALVLAPDHPLALVTPVQHALALGIPTAIIGSPLMIAPSPNLASVVNDDEMAGRMAADRAAELLHGKGALAIIGVNPDLSSTIIRSQALERELSRIAPGITIVDKRIGSYNVPREEQVLEDTVHAHPTLDVIVALMWNSADGAIRALDSMKDRPPVKLIAFDSYASPPFDRLYLDSVIQEDIRGMAKRAVEIVVARKQHQDSPSEVKLAPRLITRENVGSPEVRQMFSTELPASSWHWSSIQ